MNFAIILSLAILLDFVCSENLNFLIHPVILIGKLILFLERRLKNGYILCALVLILAGITAGIFLFMFDFNIFAQIYLIYLALAWRDLKDETLIIAESLFKNNIPEAKKFLSRVVGRDTQNLNKNEISRATIETIAENSIDGIMSVMFYALVGYIINKNLIGVFVWIFKAVSTLDSMIGYEKYKNFGKPSAKLDDILNFLPARLGGIIIIIAGGFKIKNLKIFLRDRLKHKSPNSAHGESAFGAVLNLKLGGGAYYNGKFEEREFIGGNNNPEAFDIIRAQNLLDRSCALFAIVIIFTAEFFALICA